MINLHIMKGYLYQWKTSYTVYYEAKLKLPLDITQLMEQQRGVKNGAK